MHVMHNIKGDVHSVPRWLSKEDHSVSSSVNYIMIWYLVYKILNMRQICAQTKNRMICTQKAHPRCVLVIDSYFWKKLILDINHSKIREIMRNYFFEYFNILDICAYEKIIFAHIRHRNISWGSKKMLKTDVFFLNTIFLISRIKNRRLKKKIFFRIKRSLKICFTVLWYIRHKNI